MPPTWKYERATILLLAYPILCAFDRACKWSVSVTAYLMKFNMRRLLKHNVRKHHESEWEGWYTAFGADPIGVDVDSSFNIWTNWWLLPKLQTHIIGSRSISDYILVTLISFSRLQQHIECQSFSEGSYILILPFTSKTGESVAQKRQKIFLIWVLLGKRTYFGIL